MVARHAQWRPARWVIYRAAHIQMDVIDWLLDSDPAIRWQVLRDLTDAPAEERRGRAGPRRHARAGAPGSWRSRARTACGTGGALLPVAVVDGSEEASPGPRRPTACCCCTTSASTRQMTRPAAPSRSSARTPLGARRPAVLRGRGRAVHQRHDGRARRLLRPGRRAASSTRLLGEQLADGGWNCEAENGSVRSSFAHDDQRARRPAGARARDRRDRGDHGRAPARARSTCWSAHLLRRKSTGELDRPGLPAVLVPDPLALRRAARPRLLPRGRRPAGPRAWPRRSTWCAPSSSPTAPGCWRTRTGAGSTSRWRTATAGRAAGTRCARCACCEWYES